MRDEPARHRGLPREAGAEPMALLEVDDIHTYYGNIEALKGISLDGRGGRDRHADRLQRRRQVDDAALDLRPDAAARRARSRFEGEEIARDAAAGDRPARASRSRPRAGTIFPRMTVRENLDLGAYLRRDARRSTRTSTASSTCSRACKEREKQKAGTMSGGEQQMLAIGRALMARPEAAAARRAVDGPRADPRRAHLRDDRGDQPAGHDDPARRAERELRARGLQRAATCSRPARSR